MFVTIVYRVWWVIVAFIVILTSSYDPHHRGDQRNDPLDGKYPYSCAKPRNINLNAMLQK